MTWVLFMRTFKHMMCHIGVFKLKVLPKLWKKKTRSWRAECFLCFLLHSSKHSYCRIRSSDWPDQNPPPNPTCQGILRGRSLLWLFLTDFSVLLRSCAWKNYRRLRFLPPGGPICLIRSRSRQFWHCFLPVPKCRCKKCSGVSWRHSKRKRLTGKSGQEDKLDNKIVLTPKITQNCPVRRIYFTLQVL